MAGGTTQASQAMVWLMLWFYILNLMSTLSTNTIKTIKEYYSYAYGLSTKILVSPVLILCQATNLWLK